MRTCEPRTQRCEPRESIYGLGERCATAPRIHPKPGWNRGPRGIESGAGHGLKRRWSQAICPPYNPPAYRFYAADLGELSCLKFNVFCVLTAILCGIARGSSGTLSLRLVFVWEFGFFAIVKSAAAQRRQAFDRTTPARMQT